MDITFLKHSADFIFFPIRVILEPERVRHLGLTPIIDERHNVALNLVRGKLLDIGCGPNLLVRRYGEGVGVDVYPWDGIDVLVDTTRLPFARGAFDTIAFLASLNHIPASERKKVLGETERVLKDDGQVLITMTTPVLSYIGHNFLWGWHDPDIQDRGMEEGESWGFTPRQVKRILEQAGFRVVHHKRFVYGLNHLYIAHKQPETGRL